MKESISWTGDMDITIVKTKPSVTFPQSQWNLLDNDSQWILEPKTEEEIYDYHRNTNKK